ncbi:MAG: type II CRISPR RNA-guided endonuclease Cas9 [Planctomycetaceae bacterium]|nr:type II CRISPR RNA-guided endonuclease Cas9 [Planctomycetaceae bacterium]
MITLGLDIGTNSVGSAWIDTGRQSIDVAVTIFPAGAEETDTKRGDPTGQVRRQARSQRRSIARRAARKRRLRQLLIRSGLLPATSDEWTLFVRQTESDPRKETPWHLRRLGLTEPLTAFEFGRVLLHLAQRRGARGVEWDDDEEGDAGKVKQSISHTQKEMDKRKVRTFGELMAMLYDERKHDVPNKTGKVFRDAIRNRRDAFEFHANRDLIRDEFHTLWDKQRNLPSPLAALLTDDLQKELDDPTPTSTWAVRGALFGQRRTYWNTGTLGRCELEPSDRLCPRCDMYASEFLVLQTVNSIKLEERGRVDPFLDDAERAAVIQVLRTVKQPTTATLRKALKIHTAVKKATVGLNLERMKQIELNTDWFGREIIEGVFGREQWTTLTERQQQSVNQAIQKLDDPERLRQGAAEWWGLSSEQTERLVEVWKKRPALDDRVNLSRRAIRTLLPYMRQGDDVSTAKLKHGYPAAPRALTKADRRYLRKHVHSLPPAPMILNPVVRKSIHEVRRHINSWLRRFQKKPDRIVIEFARGVTLSSRDRNDQLSANKRREAERRKIEQDFAEYIGPGNPAHKLVLRVRLWTEQKWQCAYSGEQIGRDHVGHGTDLEIDHIVPDSRGGENGYHNKVLCFRKANREKRNQTPREWLSAEKFAELERRFAHLDGRSREKIGEYELVPNPRKFKLLHSEGRPEEEWRESQLTDTSYAAVAVATYLREALYGNEPPEPDGRQRRHIFSTKGQYTGMLRRDWGLLEDLMARVDSPEATGIVEPRARRDKKDRTDHRHHAIDAVVIALCGPELLTKLGTQARDAAEYKSRTGYWPKRTAIDPPWATSEEFRQQVLAVVSSAVVAHRPVKRRIAGSLHEATGYGVVDIDARRFTTRIPLAKLTQKMLRMPTLTRDDNGRDVWQEPPLEKSGLVRDRELRRVLRDQIAKLGLNPDGFTDKQIAEVAKADQLRMPSGVPIRGITLLRTITEPVVIRTPGKPVRVFQGGNNHHFEILTDEKTGKWVGQCWDMFTVARRVRPPAGQPKLPMVIGRDLESVLNRDLLDDEAAAFYRGCRFVMSLSQGEVLYCRHKDRELGTSDAVGYFVVVKLDKDRITLAPHWDARREHTWPITPEGLRKLGPTPDEPPYKVRLEPWATRLGTPSGISPLHD